MDSENMVVDHRFREGDDTGAPGYCPECGFGVHQARLITVMVVVLTALVFLLVVSLTTLAFLLYFKVQADIQPYIDAWTRDLAKLTSAFASINQQFGTAVQDLNTIVHFINASVAQQPGLT